MSPALTMKASFPRASIRSSEPLGSRQIHLPARDIRHAVTETYGFKSPVSGLLGVVRAARCRFKATGRLLLPTTAAPRPKQHLTQLDASKNCWRLAA